jgi:hypothetical protein
MSAPRAEEDDRGRRSQQQEAARPRGGAENGWSPA